MMILCISYDPDLKPMLKASIFFLNNRNIEILMKNYSPTAYLNGYLNIAIFYFGFFAS